MTSPLSRGNVISDRLACAPGCTGCHGTGEPCYTQTAVTLWCPACLNASLDEFEDECQAAARYTPEQIADPYQLVDILLAGTPAATVTTVPARDSVVEEPQRLAA